MKNVPTSCLFIVVIACISSASVTYALTYGWNQSRVFAKSHAGSVVDISSNVSSSGCVDISEYIYDAAVDLWYVTVTNILFTLTDASNAFYSWNLQDAAATFAVSSIFFVPETGTVPLDIHLYSNNSIGFANPGFGPHAIYSEVGDPGFPFMFEPEEYGNINFWGEWIEKPSKVSEPTALILLAAGLVGFGMARRFIG